MATLVHSMAPLTINSTTIAIQDLGLSQDIIANVYQSSGAEYGNIVTVPGANPKVTFRCPLKDAYTLIGNTVLSATTFSVYFAKFSSLIRAGGSVHAKLPLASSATAAVYMTGWSVNQDGIVMADCEAVYLSADGTTHPIGALTTNNALPALTAQPTLHTAGPLSINGTVYGGLMSSGCTLNQQETIQRSDGDLYPRIYARYGGDPRLTGEHADPIGLWSIISPTGANISANVVQYYRAYDTTTGVNSATNSISITVGSGRLHPTTITTAQGQVAKTGFEVYGLSTSSTHPFVTATNASAPAVP